MAIDWLNPFEHVDRHPRGVAIVLVGVMVAGVIGGTFYTRSLQHELSGFRSASDERFSSMEQRLALFHESRARDSTRFAEEMRIADAQIHALLTGLTGFDQSTRNLITDLRRILPLLPAESSSIADINKTIDSIAVQLDTVRSTMLAVSLMDRLRHPTVASDTAGAWRRSMTPAVNVGVFLVWVVIGMFLVITFLSANFVLDRRRQRELTREIEQLRAQLGRQEGMIS